MHDNGASVQSIAHAHGMSWQYAKQILKFADTGQRPNWGPGKRSGKGNANQLTYKDIASDVVHMRDEKKTRLRGQHRVSGSPRDAGRGWRGPGRVSDRGHGLCSRGRKPAPALLGLAESNLPYQACHTHYISCLFMAQYM